MRIEKFEDIEAWKEARDILKDIFRISSELKKQNEFFLADQIKRANISIMGNIAEGFARASDKDFARFLVMAKGSASELANYLYVLIDFGHINNDIFESLFLKLDSIQRKLEKFIQYLDNKE